MKFLFPVMIFLFCFATDSFAQPANDSNLLASQIKETRKLYDRFTGQQSLIYNGRHYLPYTFRREGHPFFEAENFSDGWVGYQGMIYDSLQAQFDLSRDQLIILSPNKKRIILENARVDSFQIFNSLFVRKTADPENGLNDAGFFEILYDGHIKLFALRSKKFREDAKGSMVVRIFEQQTRFYIQKDGRYFPVLRRSHVMRVLADRQNKIKAGLKREHIKIRRKNFEQALLAAVLIYDSES